jgi:NADH:ubiquinone oxidoreductase subunit F (NADH-binding)
VLVGGYFGTWLRPEEAGGARLSRRGLQVLGASPGCGLIAVLPVDHCPLQEVAAVLRWLSSNSAGQCGACVNGLPALSGAFDAVVSGDPRRKADAYLDRWSPMVVRRGACKLPDGAVSFLDSARRVFEDHIDHHRRHGPCPPNRRAVLPTPSLDGWR